MFSVALIIIILYINKVKGVKRFTGGFKLLKVRKKRDFFVQSVKKGAFWFSVVEIRQLHANFRAAIGNVCFLREVFLASVARTAINTDMNINRNIFTNPLTTPVDAWYNACIIQLYTCIQSCFCLVKQGFRTVFKLTYSGLNTHF